MGLALQMGNWACISQGQPLSLFKALVGHSLAQTQKEDRSQERDKCCVTGSFLNTGSRVQKWGVCPQKDGAKGKNDKITLSFEK